MICFKIYFYFWNNKNKFCVNGQCTNQAHDTYQRMILRIKNMVGYFENRQPKCKVPRSKSWTYHTGRQRGNIPPVEKIKGNLPAKWNECHDDTRHCGFFFYFNFFSSVYFCVSLFISIHFIFIIWIFINSTARKNADREWIHFCTSLIRFVFVADSFYFCCYFFFHLLCFSIDGRLKTTCCYQSRNTTITTANK